MTFKILTDSTADIDQQWADQLEVDLLGLTVQLDGQTYETVGPDKLTSTVLLDKMKAGSKPQTSQINVGTFEDYFRQQAQAGQDVLYIALSSKLSGTSQSAIIARDMVQEEFPEARIIIIDTLGASLGEAYLVLEAVDQRKAGLDIEAVASHVNDLAPRVRTFFLVDDLNHLVRGGRISKAAALIGGLVNIKPIIGIQADGSLQSVAKVRGAKKAVSTVLDMALTNLDGDKVLIAYADDEAPAQVIKKTILANNSQVKSVLVAPLGPVISAHVGPGTVALFSLGKEAR